MSASYVASYWPLPPRTLLIGAVREGRSSRFQTAAQARAFLTLAIEANGKDTCAGDVQCVRGVPEIFVHCGEYATALGCKCPGCGKELTIADAKRSASVFGGNG